MRTLKILLLSIAFLPARLLQAQPILTAANTNPVVGDAYQLITCDSTGLAKAATGPGPGKIWDYSHMVISTVATTSTNRYQTGFVDSFTYIRFMPCSAISRSPTSPATIAIMRYDSVFSAYIDPLASPSGKTDSFPEFFITDSSQYYYPISMPGIPMHNRQPITLLTYPFTYNSKLVDTTPYSEMDMPFTLDFSYKSMNTITADAYGALSIPGHSYNNALRVHIITVHIDTGVLWTTWVYANYATESYQWYVPGIHVPVLEIDNDTLGGVPVSAEYYTTYDPTSSGAGVHNTHALYDVSVYPNPAHDELYVTYSSLIGQPASLRLTDVTGKCVQTVSIDKTTIGMNKTSISVAALPQGIYFLQLRIGNDVINKKISVMR